MTHCHSAGWNDLICWSGLTLLTSLTFQSLPGNQSGIGFQGYAIHSLTSTSALTSSVTLTLTSTESGNESEWASEKPLTPRMTWIVTWT